MCGRCGGRKRTSSCGGCDGCGASSKKFGCEIFNHDTGASIATGKIKTINEQTGFLVIVIAKADLKAVMKELKKAFNKAKDADNEFTYGAAKETHRPRCGGCSRISRLEKMIWVKLIKEQPVEFEKILPIAIRAVINDDEKSF